VQDPFSTNWLRLVNENDKVLHMAQTSFVGLMSLAEQRGWRATAFTRENLGAFSATDASRCAVVLVSALEDEVPPMIAVGGGEGPSQVFVDPDQVKAFVEFCRNGGFWIQPTGRETRMDRHDQA
jgi:hypothetical protein